MTVVDGYCTLDEVKADLRLRTTADDVRLESDIEAASRIIDKVSGRKWTSVTEQRTFASTGPIVFVDDASTVTLVQQSADQQSWTTAAATTYYVNPKAPIRWLKTISGYDWLAFVRISATWGSGAIPPHINKGCRLLVTRYFKRPDSPEGVLTGDFGAARLARTDPDIYRLVGSEKRMVVG